MTAAVLVGQPRNSFCCSVWLCVSHHVFLLFISCLRFVCNLYLNYTVIITATPSLLSAEPFFATMHMWNSCIYRNRVIGWSWDRNWQSQRRMLSWLLRRSRGDVLQWINTAHYRDVNCGQLSSLMRRWFYITRVECLWARLFWHPSSLFSPLSVSQHCFPFLCQWPTKHRFRILHPQQASSTEHIFRKQVQMNCKVAFLHSADEWIFSPVCIKIYSTATI